MTDVQKVSTADAASSAQNSAAARRAKKNQPPQEQVVVQIVSEQEKDLNQGLAIEHVSEPPVEDEAAIQARQAAQEQAQAEINAAKDQAAAQAAHQEEQVATKVVKEEPAAAEVVKEEPVVVREEQKEQPAGPISTADNASQSQNSAAARRAAKNAPPAEEKADKSADEVAKNVVDNTVKKEDKEAVVDNTIKKEAEKVQQEIKNAQQSQSELINNQKAQAEREIAAYKEQAKAQVDAEIAEMRRQAQAQLNNEVAEMKRQAEQFKAELAQMKQDAQAGLQKQPAAEVVADQKEQAAPQQPAEDGRPRPEPGYEYLMDLNTKELKKLAKDKDENVARNAKLEIEGRKHDRNIWTAPELTDNERSLVDAAVEASGSDKPFYKNRKAQKLLRKQLRDKNNEVVAALDKKIEEAKTDEEKQALKVFRDALDDKNLSRKYARTVVRDLKIGDRVEHTVVVDSYKDKKAAKQKLGDEAGDFRIKRHSKAFMKHNAEVKANMADKEISSHQAAYEQISGSEEDPRRISGDRTFETSEVTTAASYASDDKTRYYATRRELKRLGYKVDDGLAKKVIMPIMAALAAAGGTGAGILYTGGLSTVVEATATALAEAAVSIPELGINVASSSSSKVSTSVKINNWQNSAISAGTAALIAATMFGSPDEEIDLLRNHDRCDLFRDVSDGNGGTTRAFEQASFGNKSKTKSTKAILREIDQLDLSDEQKVALLNKAAGDKGLGKLTAKELILAYIHGMDMVAGAEEEVKPDGSCKACDEEDKKALEEENEELKKQIEELENRPPCPEPEPVVKERIKYETVDVEGTKTRTIPTLKFGGPYHYAQYYLVDGKPIKYNSPEYKAIIAQLNNGAMKETNNRKDRILSEEIDLGNGKVAKLVSDEQIAEIRKKQHPTGGGKDVKYTVVNTKDGYTILYKVDKDGARTELERGAKQAMENKRDSLNRIEEEKMKAE